MKCIVYFITEKDISTLIPHTEVSQLLFQYFNMLYLDKITLYKQKKKIMTYSAKGVEPKSFLINSAHSVAILETPRAAFFLVMQVQLLST